MDHSYIAQRARHLFNYRSMSKGYVRAYEVRDIFAKRQEPSEWFEELTPGTEKHSTFSTLRRDPVHQPGARTGIDQLVGRCLELRATVGWSGELIATSSLRRGHQRGYGERRHDEQREAWQPPPRSARGRSAAGRR